MADSIYTFDPVAANNTALDTIPYGPNQLYHNQIDNWFRALAAKLAQHVDDLGGVNTVAGTANAITATIASGITAYATGHLFWFKNTGGPNTTAATMNVNSIGAKEIRLQGDTALVGGEMVDNGYYGLLYDTAYDGGDGGWLLLNPSQASITFATNAQHIAGASAVLPANPAGLAAVTKLVAGALPTIANNGTDATNDIDFSAGSAFDINASAAPYFATCAAMTKQLDANWAAGTNQGMRYSGAAIANTTYHLWAVWKDDGTQDYYADPSATYATVLGHLQAETGGASYTHMRRIGPIVRASATIVPFTQYGNNFRLKTAVDNIVSQTPGTTGTAYALSSVPAGIAVEVYGTAWVFRSGNPSTALFYATGETAPSTAYGGGEMAIRDPSAGSGTTGQVRLLTNTSRQISVVADNAGTTINFLVRGWVDYSL